MTNQVELQGHLSRPPEEKVLPSGDKVWSFRVVVPREAGARPGVDWVDCSAWTARLRRSVATWAEGDVVEAVGPRGQHRGLPRSPACNRIALLLAERQPLRRHVLLQVLGR